MSETVKGVGNLKREIDDLMKAATEFSIHNPGEKIPKVLQGTVDELTRCVPTTLMSAFVGLMLRSTVNGRRLRRPLDLLCPDPRAPCLAIFFFHFGIEQPE